MNITDRQKEILKDTIREYIKTAKPVSSESLEKKGFDCCPATIRSEMKKLTDEGFLKQPHTSGGRVPTNKAYRFFVDEVIKTDEAKPAEAKSKKVIDELERLRDFHNETMKLAENLTKRLAYMTRGLAFAYLSGEDFIYKDGWREVFKNPEFEEKDMIDEFLETAEKLEGEIRQFADDREICFQPPTVFIGTEGKMLDSGEFSLVISRGVLPAHSSRNEAGGQAVLAILGPTRMPYDKNINLINLMIGEMERL